MNHIFDNVPKLLNNRMQATIELLQKIPAFLEEKGMSEAELMEVRLAPDMFPFKRQIQLMSDSAKGAVARLNGIEAPKMEDNEQTLTELVARLQKTIDFVKANPITDNEQAMQTVASFPFAPGVQLRAMDYVIEFLIPNFHFHATITYVLLRKEGMKLGKADYLSKLSYEQIA